MATRLDRLFLLLDTGSTAFIRKSAAEQLGDVQKLHPHELNNLLSKVHQYLCNTTWETRKAAGQAIEAISRNVPQWDPKPAPKNDECISPTGGQLVLSQFDVKRVLVHGASLLASEGREFEEEDIGFEDKEKLSRQKQQLNKRLGLDVAGGMGIRSEDLFMEEDLVTKQTANNSTAAAVGTGNNHTQGPVKDILQEQLQASSNQLSARERNRAKRKAKMLAKQTSKDGDQKDDDSDGESVSKLRKTSSVVVEQPQDDKIVVDSVPDPVLNTDEMDEWPFESFCDVLMNDLFHSSWERRHGAAIGLREVMKEHGVGIGKMPDYTEDQMGVAHQLSLEDLAVRLISVLALDRFGDYVSDEVVAPVRETCAQTLGVTLQYMTPQGVMAAVQVLVQLLGQPQWEVRHGGLLGLKYMLAVRQDQSQALLPSILPVVFTGLQDRDDDVRAVAAATLLPVVDTLVTCQAQHVPQIILCLWHTLLDLDDLTASTNSIMTLLSSLLGHSQVSSNSANMQLLSEFVPRLWPFLSHNITSVRKAALDTIQTLLTRCQSESEGAMWILPILQDALRHLFQRALLEEKEEILLLLCEVWTLLVASVPTDHLVAAASPWASVWVCLMMQPPSVPFDLALLIQAKHTPKELTPSRARHTVDSSSTQTKDQRLYLAGSASIIGSAATRDTAIINARKTAAKLLGTLSAFLMRPVQATPDGLESPLEALPKLLVFHLSSKSAIQRTCIGQVMKEWAKASKTCDCPEMVKSRLHDALTELIYFDEIALSFTRMQTDCKDFISSLKQQKIDTDSVFLPGSILTLDQAQVLCTTFFDSIASTLKPKFYKLFDERRKQLISMVEQTNTEQILLSTRVQSSLAGAAIWLQSLPDKMNPVVRPVMEALKKEQNQQLQILAAEDVSHLVNLCVSRTPSPTSKIIKNLCSSLCSDPRFTPVIGQEGLVFTASDLPAEASCDKYSGILTLFAQQITLEGRGRKGASIKKPHGLMTEISLENIAQEEDEDKKQLLIQRRGAMFALKTMVKDSGADLVDKLPQLWNTIMELLDKAESSDIKSADVREDVDSAQTLVNALQVLEICASSFHESVQQKLVSRLPVLCQCLENPFTVVRHMASRCLGTLSKAVTVDTMNHVLENVLPNLGASEDNVKRQGAIEALSNITEQLGVDVVVYIVLLVVPVLGRMGDMCVPVRLMATNTFASLVRLLPLEATISDPPAMKAELIKKKEEERQFLEQLLDGSKVANYKISVPIQAELRKYQQDGVNWLAFLNKYKLHGILCDDMGLGKTLQSICILAGDHKNRAEKYEESKQADCAPLPSIVVCPPTLTGHWIYEIEKFVSKEYLNPLHYHGPPAERHKLQKKAKKHNLIVASYDVVRNDIDFFGKINWNYCILDEGHIIKNSKTKISKAVKQLLCNHRLILSGTPIQNNVLELWSLFDFLIPGFLGSEKQFQARFGKPILQSRDAKSSTKEQEAGALAMEALHRQVLPFLLRRLKEDVLKDLPPKIIQDYYCDLSPLQVTLYEDFAKSRAKKTVDDSVQEVEKKEKRMAPSGTNHIFQALQYLRKVCNHPALVLTPQHPQYEDIMNDLKKHGTRGGTSVRDLQHAPKLVALKQLLQDCGIGGTVSSGASGSSGATAGSDSMAVQAVVNQHRVLLFCQLKSMLDIVEQDLLRSQMPSVTYLRLDGSVPPGNRHSIVNRFNNDPSIDILLLTTHVGGLGLNLAGADTVIFVEHDWNPMKDLQAMDRAHRIGQKKVVNVYRLVTRGTLEEKIMGLQKFKLKMANSIISQDNSSLSSMGTDQLLELFSLEETKAKSGGHRGDAESGGDASSSSGAKNPTQDTKATMKSILENVEDLWDEKLYETEYNMESFMKSLQAAKQ